MTGDPTMLPLVVTMGDPAGIGPEIVVRAVGEAPQGSCAVVGDLGVMRRAARLVGGVAVAAIDSLDDVPRCPLRCLPVLQPEGLPADLASLKDGAIDARAGAAAARCIEKGVELVLAGSGAALVTAPIHKAALHAAGVPYPGHTEMLQKLAGNVPIRMMLANDELRVVLVTIHVALRVAIDQVTRANVEETIRITHAAAAAWALGRPPRIAVAGLNPHAGEGGLFGDEDRREIEPAVRSVVAEGIDATGPIAPDTVFMRARRGEFDVVVAMTHDHGLIPVKYLGIEHGVNVTLGLPFVRTSPDHGTAFDRAWQGSADPSSLRAAMRMARRLTTL